MFEFLGGFNHILVTGVQRSGTTICAQMIAHDLGYKWYKEEKVKGEDWIALYKFLTDFRGMKLVLQCPRFCYCIERVSLPSNAIVFMVRNKREVLKAQRDIGWDASKEMQHPCYRGYKDIVEAKKQYWETVQKHGIYNAFEVNYRSLAKHPLWIPARLRKDFASMQTSLASPYTFDDSPEDKKLREKLYKRGRIV